MSPPSPGRFDVVAGTLLLVMALFVRTPSSTRSNPVCPVAVEVGTPGDCRCSILDEIHCRGGLTAVCSGGLTAVPVIDANASYTARRTYMSLYLTPLPLSLPCMCPLSAQVPLPCLSVDLSGGDVTSAGWQVTLCGM